MDTYTHMDLDRACTMLQSMDLDRIFASDDVDDCWWRCMETKFFGHYGGMYTACNAA